jgi:hypothetical protein
MFMAKPPTDCKRREVFWIAGQTGLPRTGRNYGELFPESPFPLPTPPAQYSPPRSNSTSRMTPRRHWPRARPGKISLPFPACIFSTYFWTFCLSFAGPLREWPTGSILHRSHQFPSLGSGLKRGRARPRGHPGHAQRRAAHCARPGSSRKAMRMPAFRSCFRPTRRRRG